MKGYIHLSAPKNRYMHTTASKGRILQNTSYKIVKRWHKNKKALFIMYLGFQMKHTSHRRGFLRQFGKSIFQDILLRKLKF